MHSRLDCEARRNRLRLLVAEQRLEAKFLHRLVAASEVDFLLDEHQVLERVLPALAARKLVFDVELLRVALDARITADALLHFVKDGLRGPETTHGNLAVVRDYHSRAANLHLRRVNNLVKPRTNSNVQPFLKRTWSKRLHGFEVILAVFAYSILNVNSFGGYITLV